MIILSAVVSYLEWANITTDYVCEERNLENLRDPFVVSSPLLLVNSVDEFGVPQFDCQIDVSLNTNIVFVGACVWVLDGRRNERANEWPLFSYRTLTATAQNIV